jgi:hypothetical protein
MGFTLQFTLKVIPHERAATAPASTPASAPVVAKGKAVDAGPSSSAEGRLIETE